MTQKLSWYDRPTSFWPSGHSNICLSAASSRARRSLACGAVWWCKFPKSCWEILQLLFTTILTLVLLSWMGISVKTLNSQTSETTRSGRKHSNWRICRCHKGQLFGSPKSFGFLSPWQKVVSERWRSVGEFQLFPSSFNSRAFAQYPQKFQSSLPALRGQETSLYSCCKLTGRRTNSNILVRTWSWNWRKRIQDAKLKTSISKFVFEHQNPSTLPSRVKNQSRGWLWKLKVSINVTTWWCSAHTRIQTEPRNYFVITALFHWKRFKSKCENIVIEQ